MSTPWLQYRSCDFGGCSTLIWARFPWSLCDDCYDHACELDDSERFED